MFYKELLNMEYYGGTQNVGNYCISHCSIARIQCLGVTAWSKWAAYLVGLVSYPLSGFSVLKHFGVNIAANMYEIWL